MDLVEALRWGRAIGSLLSLGLVMGFSPTLYGYTLHALTRRTSATRAIVGMVAGIAVASTAMVLLFQFFDPDNLAALLRHRIGSLLLERGVDLAAGVVLLLGGFAVLLLNREGRMRPSRPPREHDVPVASRWDAADEGKVGAVSGDWRRGFLFGLANTFIGLSGVATMYITGRVASGVSPDLLLRAVAYLPFLITLVGPYLLLLWAWDRYPALAAAITRDYDRVSKLDLRRPAGIALLIAGAVFLAMSLLRGA